MKDREIKNVLSLLQIRLNKAQSATDELRMGVQISLCI